MAGHPEENDRRMIQYLLGTLPEAERTRLEDDYFADDTRFEELAAVEAELIDAYVRGELARSERAQFEARYLATSEQRARVAFARQLVGQSDKTPVETPAKPAVWRRWARLAPGWLSWRPWLVPGLAGAGLILVLGVGWWTTQPSSLPAATEANRGQSPASAPSQVAPPARVAGATPPSETTAERPPGSGRRSAAIDVIALVLAPGLTRSPGQGSAMLAVPSGTSHVRIQLDHEGESYPSYRAVLLTPEGQEVWRQSGFAPVQPGVKSVVVVVPAAMLRPGDDYVLTLSGSTPRGPIEVVAEYTFRVARR